MLKREELIEDIDIEYIISSLGIPIKKQGRYIDILCPKHVDTNFGSCKLDIRKKTCHCFVCNETMTAFDLVMAQNGGTYFEAFKYVAELTGDSSRYIINDKKQDNKTRKFPLTKEELDLLDINYICYKNILELSQNKPNLGQYTQEGDNLYVQENMKRYSPQILWENNPFEFFFMIAYKIYQLKEKYRELSAWLNESSESWESSKKLDAIIQKLKLQSFMVLVEKKIKKIELSVCLTDNKNLPF